MNKSFFLSAFTVILFLYSCKKDNNSPNNQNGSLPKTYTEDIRSSVIGNSVTTYNLLYDANNRIVSMTSADVPTSQKFTYKYASDNSFTMDLYEYSVLSIHENFWLNPASLVDSTFQYNNTEDTLSEKYIYNSTKELIQKKTYNYNSSSPVLYSTTNYTYDNSGNATMESDDLGNTTIFDYYPDLPNTLSLGQIYLPQPLNLVKSSTITSGSDTETATHYYTFDNSNRLIKDSAAISGSDFIAIKSYTY